MAYKDLHSEAFDDGTIRKLEIFEAYAEAWLPTFIMRKDRKEIHVFDLFAGPGYDLNGVLGSPIRILLKVESFLGQIFQTKTKVVLHFNEFEPNKKLQSKFSLLKNNVTLFLDDHPKLKEITEINYYNENAESIISKLDSKMAIFPSLVLIDQNGIRFLSKPNLQSFSNQNETDFLFFVSSSYVWRFGNTSAFQSSLPLNIDQVKTKPFLNIHREIISFIKTYDCLNPNLELFPFTLKKGSAVYGIVFGATHLRAVDKFLGIVWKRNAINGEADFDIDKDQEKGQLNIFAPKKLTKIEAFQSDLEEKILTEEIRTNKDALIFTYKSGHIPTHAKLVVQQLVASKKLLVVGSTGLSYESVIKNKKLAKYQIL